ncbi:MAG TPA: FecR family protein, partial [Pyrinomonadaceae bacterium]|nr:FecR family protein [Pyrinomonadaceae bacterium]
MRTARINWIPTLFVIALVVSMPLAIAAQPSRNKFVISAKAGGVNAVTGRATMRAHGQSEWQQLTIKEDLEAGDIVKTGTDGRIEMLLNPGSYLRIGENSEVELSDNSLQNLEVRLIRGTAIVEATGFDGAALLINITTPHTRMAIVRKGLYRVSVVPGDATELIVRKGRVMLDGSHTKVDGGNKVVFSGTSFSVAKLRDTEKRQDDLEAWSKDRSKTIAQANRGFNRRDMSLAMLGFNSGWGRLSPSLSGIWMYSAGYGCYTFFPFYTGWGSPYGGSYYNSLYPYNCCGRYGYGGYNNTNNTPGGYSPPYNAGGGSTGNPNNPPSSPPPSSSPGGYSEPRTFPSMPPASEPRSFPGAGEGRVSPVSDQ